MENFDDDKPAPWYTCAIAARGFVRGATILIGAGLLYAGFAALWKEQSVAVAMQFFGSMLALMVMLCVSHAVTPSEVSEIKARTSARGVLRWLALAACSGSVLCGQFAGFWLHDFKAALWCDAAAAGINVAFAAIYLLYCLNADSDKVASKRSVSRDGTARATLIQMAGLTAVSFMLSGISGGAADRMLTGIGLAIGSICLFAIYNAVFTYNVHIDEDRG